MELCTCQRDWLGPEGRDMDPVGIDVLVGHCHSEQSGWLRESNYCSEVFCRIQSLLHNANIIECILSHFGRLG